MVVDERPDEILLLGGNQDDAVSLKWFPKSRVRENGYRWPLAIEINKAIKRRGHIKGSGGLVSEQSENPVEIKKPWYKKVDWSLWIKTIVAAVGAFMQTNPRLVAIGEILLGWTEKIGGKQKTGFEKLIDAITEFFKLLIAKLKKNKSDSGHE